MTDITEEQFKDYERVRKSGATNMLDTGRVAQLSDNLEQEDVKTIIKNYDELTEEYGRE